MATIKSQIDADGRAEVVQDNGTNPDGSKAETRWSIPAGQIAKHLPMFNAGDARQLSAGDRSALADAAAQFGKK